MGFASDAVGHAPLRIFPAHHPQLGVLRKGGVPAADVVGAGANVLLRCWERDHSVTGRAGRVFLIISVQGIELAARWAGQNNIVANARLETVRLRQAAQCAGAFTDGPARFLNRRAEQGKSRPRSRNVVTSSVG